MNRTKSSWTERQRSHSASRNNMSTRIIRTLSCLLAEDFTKHEFSLSTDINLLLQLQSLSPSLYLTHFCLRFLCRKPWLYYSISGFFPKVVTFSRDINSIDCNSTWFAHSSMCVCVAVSPPLTMSAPTRFNSVFWLTWECLADIMTILDKWTSF